jgi:hypothetical protein
LSIDRTIGGLPYHRLPDPVRQVGAALDSNTFHPGRSAAQHLRIIATVSGLPRHRVDEVLGLTGLADVAGRRVGGFSLGMRQRLSLAGALLGDPGVLVFDEPLNGLDPDGIRWLRGLLRELAEQDRTVFVSSHLRAAVYQMLKFGAITCVVMLILGILAAGSEFRHRTIVPVLLATPHRARVFAVKVAVVAGLGTVVSAACFGMIGVALGALTRNTIGAIVAAIAWTLFVEQVILAAIVPGIEKWLPTGAAIGLTNAPGPGPAHSLRLWWPARCSPARCWSAMGSSCSWRRAAPRSGSMSPDAGDRLHGGKHGDGVNRDKQAAGQRHVGRRGASWRRIGHEARVDRVDDREVLHIGVEDGGLDQGLQRCPGGGQDRIEVAQCQLGLRLDAVTGHAGGRIDTGRARAEHEAAGHDGLAVGSERDRRAVGGDCFPGHLALPFMGLGLSWDWASHRIGPRRTLGWPRSRFASRMPLVIAPSA